MTSIPPTATPIPGAAAINPQLAAIVQQLPANQQQAAMAKIAAMTPEQQQQLLAEVARQSSGSVATQGATSGAQSATLAASALEPPSKVSTILKHVGIFGGIGAALGFGASFFTLPVVGQVAAPIAAAVGGGIGVIAGVISGFMSHKKQQAAYEQAVAAEQQAAAAMPAAGAAPAEDAPVGVPAEDMEPIVVKRPRASNGGRRYTVVSGDSLSVIAARYDMSWQKLYEANREAVGSNPHLIHPGLKLKIPA